MIRLLRWMLGLCNHSWKRFAHRELMYAEPTSNGPVGSRVYYECQKCGLTKTEDFL